MGMADPFASRPYAEWLSIRHFRALEKKLPKITNIVWSYVMLYFGPNIQRPMKITQPLTHDFAPPAGVHRRPVRRADVADLPGAARGADRDGDRRDAVRLHPAVDHAPLLAGAQRVPALQVQLDQRPLLLIRPQPQEGRLLLDQQGSGEKNAHGGFITEPEYIYV